MKVAVIQRHVVFDAKAAEKIDAFFSGVLDARERTGYGYHVVLSYKPEVANPQYFEIKQEELAREGVDARFRQWTRPDAGTNFYNALDIGASAEATFVLSSDDFPVYDRTVAETINHCVKYVFEDGHPAAVGQRTAIKLSTNPTMDRRRQIHEMFLATLFPENDMNFPFGGDVGALPRAYAVLGDRFSGFYAIDNENPAGQKIVTGLRSTRDMADMETTFAPEYLFSLLAAGRGTLQLVCVPRELDDAGSQMPEPEVNHLIQHSTRQLIKTAIGPRLWRHLTNPKARKGVSKYYDKNEVRFVERLMTKE